MNDLSNAELDGSLRGSGNRGDWGSQVLAMVLDRFEQFRLGELGPAPFAEEERREDGNGFEVTVLEGPNNQSVHTSLEETAEEWTRQKGTICRYRDWHVASAFGRQITNSFLEPTVHLVLDVVQILIFLSIEGCEELHRFGKILLKGSMLFCIKAQLISEMSNRDGERAHHLVKTRAKLATDRNLLTGRFQSQH
jgi:hypothetical protein